MQNVTASLANAEEISMQYCWLSQKWINKQHLQKKKRKKKSSVGFGLFDNAVRFFKM